MTPEELRKDGRNPQAGKMVRAGTISTNEILPLLGSGKIMVLGKLVKSSSLRLRCFKENGITCKVCGRTGEFFAVEKHIKSVNDSHHLNLYAVDPDGVEVLITHDHIVPLSRGGADSFHNTQTMCAPCNLEKGCSTISQETQPDPSQSKNLGKLPS
jgi:hypothetical protein